MTVEDFIRMERLDLTDEEVEEVCTYISYMEDSYPIEEIVILNYVQELYPQPTWH